MNTQLDETELRRSTRLLESVLARVSKIQAGPEVAATVEQLQRGFTRLRRDGGIARRQHLFDAIEPLEPAVISAVVKAFNLYFSLVNIAEESYCLRLRRRQAERGGHYWNGSFHDTLLTLKQSRVSREKLQVLLDELLYLPVMTAHPTDTKRRIVKGALRNIFLTHEKLDDPHVRGYFRQEVLERLQGEMWFYRYNKLETAIYELTMGVTGLLKASVRLVQPVTENRPEDLAVMSELARIGEHGYRAHRGVSGLLLRVDAGERDR